MTNGPVSPPSTAQPEYWNRLALPWATHHERADRAFAGLGVATLQLAAPQCGENVLDVGCGSGTTVLELATRVGSCGHVVGADISAQCVARARERIAAAGLSHAEVIETDVATHSFPTGSFDLAFSRLGVMFFSDPTAALANVYRAMKPAARVVLAVFRPASENPWPSAPVGAVDHLLPPIPPPGPDDPGMFSWGDPARVRRILEGAGYREISLTPLNLDCQLAGHGGVAEAAEFALLFGPLVRRVSGLSEAQVAEVRATLEGFFQRHATPQGVTLPSAFWIVQARV